MKNVILSTVMAVMLASCASMQPMSDTQKVETLCASATASLKVLRSALDEGRMPMQLAQDTLTAVRILRPVCTAETPPVLSDAQLKIVEGATEVMVDASKKVQK